MAIDRIVLRLNSVTLPTGVTHTYTDWQVSDDINFDNIVLESLNDEESKLLKIFYATLEDKTYYARARMLLSTGYTKWAKLKDFTPATIDNTTLGLTIPISIGVPKVTTSSDINNHKLSDFSIYITNPPLLADEVQYTSTTWIIEDIFGKVAFIQPNDSDNMNRLDISTIRLKPLSIYRIKAFRKTDSNDISPMGTITIKTTAE